jgi:hypothetical protein
MAFAPLIILTLAACFVVTTAGFGSFEEWKDKQDGQKTLTQMPELSVWASHKPIPQSELLTCSP